MNVFAPAGHNIEQGTLSDPGKRLWWTEIALILAFWSFLSLLMATGRILDPRSGSPEAAVIFREIGRAFVVHSFWVVVTPFVFRGISRYPVEWHNGKRRVAAHLLVAFLVAIVADIFGDFIRNVVLPPVGDRVFHFNPLQQILRLWFLNELIIYFVIFAAGVARDYFLRYRARLEEAAQLRAQLAEARLEALRMQLNPHFLFNTLHAVSSLVEQDPRGVRRMIARLSDLLRYTLDESDRQEVPLRQELAFLRDYLEIQQIRFQGRLEVVEDVAPDTLEGLLPGLILQPLVENAIKHGVSKTEGRGLIEIGARRIGDRLQVSVSDNGPEAPTEANNGGTKGLGLANTRERLEALYGPAHELRLERREEGGFVATLSVPFHTRRDLHAARIEP